MKSVKNYSVFEFLEEFNLLKNDKRILNAGSSSTRFGLNCLNIDIQPKENVDLVCDLHDLPGDIGEFDAIVCNAVLQYCDNPMRVADNFFRVLKHGGYLFVDVPWVQPFCFDTPDKYRYSEYALKNLFSQFEILRVGPSIRSGSAFVVFGVHIANNITSNKFINYALSKFVGSLLFPFKYLETKNPSWTAGAIFLIGKKV